MGEINITYETLFEILRKEKTTQELQTLKDSFFQDTINYIKEKEDTLKQHRNKLDFFSVNEKEKIEKQLVNIRRMLKELYGRREKKIISMAVSKARIGSDIVDTNSLMPEEKKMFDELVNLFCEYRKSILFKMLVAQSSQSSQNEPGNSRNESNKANEVNEENSKEKKEEEKTTLVRFLHAVPKFVGKELEVYGPFEEEDIASMPKDIANVLINKGRAEEVKEE